MRKFHVTVFYVHASGDKWVSADASDIMLARAYGVGWVLVDLEWAELRFTPFGEIHLRKLPENPDRHPAFVEPYKRLWDSLTAEDWLDSTTEETIVLPVSTINFREGAEGTYVDLQDSLRPRPVAVG
jgi:hypothetical protein